MGHVSTTNSAGCVILLVDESAGMGAVMGETVADGSPSTKSNAQRVATSVNSLLGQLRGGGEFEIALVGYQANGQGEVNVGCRWGGPLAGREFVRVSELAASPLRVESRTRKLAQAGGGTLEQTVEFPIWYEPSVGVKAPQIAAFDYCRQLLERWCGGNRDQTGVPLVIHVCSGSSADGNPQMAVNKLMELATPGGAPLLLQAHLAAKNEMISSLYPSNQAYLNVGAARDLFRRASVLPAHLAAALREGQVSVNHGARGAIHNAKIADLIRLLGLVKTHTKGWQAASTPSTTTPTAAAAPAVAAPASVSIAPAATAAASIPPAMPSAQAAPMTPAPAAESAASVPAEPAFADTTLTSTDREQTGLVVFVLDRSVDDPFSGNAANPCTRLQEHANDLLRQISKLKEGSLDAAILSYGLDASGQCEVRETFEGPLAGKSIVGHAELAGGAIRVDEYEEQVSDGVGGVISMNRKQPIYYDVEPTSAVPPEAAFAAARRIIAQWCSEHPSAESPPIVLHLTRGEVEPAAMQQAAAQLSGLNAMAGPVALYHLVATEAPHASLAYPETGDALASAGLRTLWEVSSLLVDAPRLEAQRPGLKPGAHGIVVNGKFDLLLESVKPALATV